MCCIHFEYLVVFFDVPSSISKVNLNGCGSGEVCVFLCAKAHTNVHANTQVQMHQHECYMLESINQ
jgi:hypothetical protein